MSKFKRKIKKLDLSKTNESVVLILTKSEGEEPEDEEKEEVEKED